MATKDSLARGIQRRISKIQGPEEYQKTNIEFARSMSDTIGSALENLTINNELQMDPEQKKAFEDILSVLEKISTSSKDTEKERLEIRKFLAKAVAQAEIQIDILETEKKEKTIVKEENELKIQTLEKQLVVLTESKAKIEEEAAPKIEAAEIQIKRLEKEKEDAKGNEKKIKKLEAQQTLVEEEKNKLQLKIKEVEQDVQITREERDKIVDENSILKEEINNLETKQQQQQTVADQVRKADPGAGKGISGKEMFKKGLVTDLSRMFPGVEFAQQEGEGFKGMLARNAKSILSPKGMFNALWGQTAKSEPKFDTLVQGEKEAARIKDQKETLGGQKIGTTISSTTTSSKISSEELKFLEKQGILPSDPEGRERVLKKIEAGKQTSSSVGSLPTSGNTDSNVITDAIHEETNVIKNIFDLLQNMESIQKKQDQEKDREKNTVTSNEQESLFGESSVATPSVISGKGPVAAQLAASPVAPSATGASSEPSDASSNPGSALGSMLSMFGGGVGRRLKGGSRLLSKFTGKGLSKGLLKGAGKGLSKGLLKGAGKSLLKKIPGLGLVAGLGFGASRLLGGDWKGALGEVASGAASTIPGIGTAASVAIDAGLAARDSGAFGSVGGADSGTGDALENATDQATPPMIPPMPAAPTNNIVNNIGASSSKGMSPNFAPASVRSLDNSFIRFQDKRVARI